MSEQVRAELERAKSFVVNFVKSRASHQMDERTTLAALESLTPLVTDCDSTSS